MLDKLDHLFNYKYPVWSSEEVEGGGVMLTTAFSFHQDFEWALDVSEDLILLNFIKNKWENNLSTLKDNIDNFTDSEKRQVLLKRYKWLCERSYMTELEEDLALPLATLNEKSRNCLIEALEVYDEEFAYILADKAHFDSIVHSFNFFKEYPSSIRDTVSSLLALQFEGVSEDVTMYYQYEMVDMDKLIVQAEYIGLSYDAQLSNFYGRKKRDGQLQCIY